MKKTVHIDEGMLRDAKKACGAGTHTETVRPNGGRGVLVLAKLAGEHGIAHRL